MLHKYMDAKELKNKNAADLQKLLSERRESVRDGRFNASAGQLKNVRAIRSVKKDIARILTALNALRTGQSAVK